MVSPAAVQINMWVTFKTIHGHSLTGQVIGCVYGNDGKMKRDNITHLVIRGRYDVEQNRPIFHPLSHPDVIPLDRIRKYKG